MIDQDHDIKEDVGETPGPAVTRPDLARINVEICSCFKDEAQWLDRGLAALTLTLAPPARPACRGCGGRKRWLTRTLRPASRRYLQALESAHDLPRTHLVEAAIAEGIPGGPARE